LLDHLFYPGTYLFALLAQGDDFLAEADRLLFLLGKLVAQAAGIALGIGGGFACRLEQLDGAIDLLFQRRRSSQIRGRLSRSCRFLCGEYSAGGGGKLQMRWRVVSGQLFVLTRAA
jgi:hypothetical protein